MKVAKRHCQKCLRLLKALVRDDPKIEKYEKKN